MRHAGHVLLDTDVTESGRARRLQISLVALFVGLVLRAPAGAQENQFGGQDRANAARHMIVLAVEQGIASLPPVSGQAFSYEYDPATDTYARSKRLGPTSLRSTQTIGEGKLSLRLATSYMELADSFGPMTYALAPEDPSLPGPRGFAKFGLTAKAKVGLINLAASYGLTQRLELTLNVPLVVVDVQASQSFTTRPDTLSVPPGQAVLSGASTQEGLDELLRTGGLVFRRETFRDLGFSFNDGTHVGLGRISVGGKAVLYAGQRLRLAVTPEFFFPSPNEAQFAGSESASIAPRLVAQLSLAEWLKLHQDAGYDYDFSEAELRRFVWDTGVSVPLRRLTFDCGIGGSVFDTPIEWTPRVALGAATATFPATTATALGDNTIGDTFIDMLLGIKLRVSDHAVISGAVTVPLNDQGFRPAAIGTLAVEQYF